MSQMKAGLYRARTAKGLLLVQLRVVADYVLGPSKFAQRAQEDGHAFT
jgi:hypothetical protein